MSLARFTLREARTLRKVAEQYYAAIGSAIGTKPPNDSLRTYIAYVPADATIPGRSGADVAHGPLEVYRISNDGDLEETGSETIETFRVEVYNLSELQIPSDSYILVHQERMTGRYVWNGEGGFFFYEMIQDLVEGSDELAAAYKVRVSECGTWERVGQESGDPTIGGFLCATLFTGVAFGFDEALNMVPEIHSAYRGDIVIGISKSEGLFAIGTGRTTERFELKESITAPCTEATVYRVREDGSRIQADSGYHEATVHALNEWKGVAYAASPDLYPVNGEAACRGDFVTAIWIKPVAGESGWRVVGSGHIALQGTYQDGSDSVVCELDCGTCGTAGGRSVTIELAGDNVCDFDNGDTVTILWTPEGWVPICSFPGAGCGLKFDDDGQLEVDNEELAGCGLAVDTDCSIKVDNAALAGTGLDVSGTCGLQLDPEIITRIEDLELCCATLTTAVEEILEILDDHESRITALEACCEQNTADIYACCVGKEEMDVVYEVTCADGVIQVETTCIYVKTCP